MGSSPIQAAKIFKMITKYKYIHFEVTKEIVNDRPVWDCKNNKSNAVLSKIFFNKQWKEYCFTQSEQGVIFNDGCLLDTVDFIKQLNKTIQWKISQKNL